MWPFNGKEKVDVSEPPAYFVLKAPDMYDTKGKLAEIKAKRKVALEIKDRVADYFKVYDPPQIYLEYGTAAWELIDLLFDCLLDLNDKSQKWIDERNRMVGELKALHEEVRELRKMQQAKVAKLKDAGKKKR